MGAVHSTCNGYGTWKRRCFQVFNEKNPSWDRSNVLRAGFYDHAREIAGFTTLSRVLDLVVMSGTLMLGENLFETPSQYGQATFVGLEANTSMFGASTVSCKKVKLIKTGQVGSTSLGSYQALSRCYN